MDSQSTRTDTPSSKLITILVAIYEAGDFIRAKIDNLQQLQQFNDCWIVLLNCQDKHKESLCYSRFLKNHDNVIEIKYNNHTKLYSTWNDGIKATNSTYIMNSNADDMLHPSYVKLCTEYLDEHPQIAAVSSRIAITNEPNQLWPNWKIDDEMPFRTYPEGTAGPCPVWRREMHTRYGLFDDRCDVIGDAVMWEKWLLGGEKFGLLNQRLVLYYRNQLSLERRKDSRGESLIKKDLRRIGRIQ